MEFAGFYYPELLRDGLSFFRIAAQELGLTDEDARELHIQLLRAMAAHGHVANTRLDVVAGELLLPTAQLLDSVKAILAMLGLTTASASPAKAPMLLKLSEVTTVNKTDFVPPLAEFSTDSVPSITYEDLDGSDLDRTDRVSYCWGLESTQGGSDGVVDSSAPDIFQASSLSVTIGSSEGQYVFISTPGTNVGAYRIVEVVQESTPGIVRVTRMSGRSKDPAFQTASSLSWTLRAFTDNEADAVNTDSVYFSPWSSPVADDMLIVGHTQCMPDQIDLTFQTVASGIAGVWEYYDKEWSKFYPDAVTLEGGGTTLKFEVATLLGTKDATGAVVTVRCVLTGEEEICTGAFSSSLNVITTTGLLGQGTASLDKKDYEVTAEWVPFEDASDGTSDMTQAGSVTMASVPQTSLRAWASCEINEAEAVFFRYRIVSVSTPTAPSIDRVKIDSGGQYIYCEATQGETFGPTVVGNGDGTSGQSFTLPNTPHLDGTDEVEVEEASVWQAYDRVVNFNSSKPYSRHYTVATNAKGEATITFGDGVNGKVPPVGADNVRATQRVGGGDSGNVGANTVTVNGDGLAGIASVTNPRPAWGWRMQEGATTADLERVKRVIPASLRSGTGSKAIDASDAARLAVEEFVDADGVKPVARAVGFEEGMGPKTIKLLVVGAGGAVLSSDQRADLEEWFNGDRTARPPVAGRLVMNHRVYVVNYTPITVSIVANVVWPNGSAVAIQSALLSLLRPLALEGDEYTYVWDFEAEVSLSRIYTTIHNVHPAISDVPSLTVNGVASSLTLTGAQLPVSDASSLSISII